MEAQEEALSVGTVVVEDILNGTVQIYPLNNERGHPLARESVKASPTHTDQIAATNSAVLVRGALEGRNTDMPIDTGSAVTIVRGDM